MKSFTHYIPKLSIIALASSLLFACTSQENLSELSGKVSLPAGVSLVETVVATEERLAIPFKKYVLANGLTVILHQDNSDPLVHVDVTYHVGSAREQLGKSGFAHFFEHMMFQGSKNITDEQHFKIVTQSGGNLNGTTNTDRTNYYETVPKNQLEKMLWLESDRMGFLLEAITTEKFEVQRSTVKNERGQNVDNRPYGRLNETVNQMIYPREHPYSWPVIGYMTDLDRGTVTDLKAFFSRWYGPNNAVLTIGGDIDESQTLMWINQYFGGLKTGPEVDNIPKQLISLPDNRYYSFSDNVSLPLLYISFPTVYGMHEDEAALDVFSNIIGNGPTSLLYKNLVKSGVAVQAGANHPCSELGCKMSFFALPNPQKGMELAKIEQVINDTLLEFEQRGVNDEDLLKTKVGIETDTIYGLQSVSGKVSTLAHYQTILGNADYTEQQVVRYNNVTKADVMDVYQKYIKGKGAAILSIYPQGQPQVITKPNDFVLPDVNNPPEIAQLDLPIMKNTSSFDRSITPKAGANPQVEVPKLWRESFGNGLQIIATENSETPTVSLLLSIEGGTLLDPIEKAGIASLTASLMNEGTSNYIKEELSNELAKLGSDIYISSSGRNTTVRVSSLVKNLDATLLLMLDMMLNPAFDKNDFDRVKNQLIQSLEQGSKDARTLASRALKQVTYGTNNRVGLPSSGTINTVSAIELSDIKDFYKQYFSPKHASLVIVGDVSKSEILPKLDYLKSWQGGDYTIPVYSNFPKVAANKIYFVDLPNATQSVIKYSRRAMTYDATGEYFKATLMNYPLGSAFNSRINLNLREDKGYTYGASSHFSAGKTLGRFSAGASVKKEHTYDAMMEIEKELAHYQKNGLTTDEVDFMRQAISQNEALSYETPAQKSGFLRQLLQFDLAENYGELQSEIIKTITLEQLNDIAAKELSKSMQWIVVGDGEVIKSQLEKMNLDIIELPLAK
ncbi:M16 family metallopeptidase [Candidatus Colwellia aromaticivorans]|uniref:M16 family metallopeptidase n=1 Tax=Candidatus Colwellia aromaticivorans TaxID=2267621 RepID=UPI001FE90DD4|nr:pitrilysin family protein [Candidatus Colwellia aromaticivorans]